MLEPEAAEALRSKPEILDQRLGFIPFGAFRVYGVQGYREAFRQLDMYFSGRPYALAMHSEYELKP